MLDMVDFITICTIAFIIHWIVLGDKFTPGSSKMRTFCVTNNAVYKFISEFSTVGTITWLEFYLDKLMLSGSDDGTVCVWKCGSWKCTHTLSGHKYVYSRLAHFNAAGRRFVWCVMLYIN